MILDDFTRENPVFTHKEVTEYLQGIDGRSAAAVDSFLAYHVRRGHLGRVRQGLYFVVPPDQEAQLCDVDMYLVGAKVAPDSVLTYSTALSFYADEPQPVGEQLIFMTETKVRRTEFRDWRLIPVPPAESLKRSEKPLTEVEQRTYKNAELRISSPARTLVDVLDRLAFCGGWQVVWPLLKKLPKPDLNAVMAYLDLLGNASAVAKVGWFLETHRVHFSLELHLLEELRKRIPDQPRYLERSKRGGTMVPRWNLIVPDELLEFVSESKPKPKPKPKVAPAWNRTEFNLDMEASLPDYPVVPLPPVEKLRGESFNKGNNQGFIIGPPQGSPKASNNFQRAIEQLEDIPVKKPEPAPMRVEPPVYRTASGGYRSTEPSPYYQRSSQARSYRSPEPTTFQRPATMNRSEPPRYRPADDPVPGFVVTQDMAQERPMPEPTFRHVYEPELESPMDDVSQTLLDIPSEPIENPEERLAYLDLMTKILFGRSTSDSATVLEMLESNLWVLDPSGSLHRAPIEWQQLSSQSVRQAHIYGPDNAAILTVSESGQWFLYDFMPPHYTLIIDDLQRATFLRRDLVRDMQQPVTVRVCGNNTGTAMRGRELGEGIEFLHYSEILGRAREVLKQVTES